MNPNLLVITLMTKLVDSDLKRGFITLFHILRKLKRNLFSRYMEDIKLVCCTLHGIKT